MSSPVVDSYFIPAMFEAQPVTQERIIEVVTDAGEKSVDVQEVVEKDVEVVSYVMVPEYRQKFVPVKVQGTPIEIPRYIDKKVSCIAKVHVYEDEVSVKEIPSYSDLPKVDEKIDVVEKETVQILYVPEDIDIDVPVYDDIVTERVEPVDVAFTIECRKDETTGQYIAPIPTFTESVQIEKIAQPIEVPTPVLRDVPDMGFPRTLQLVWDIPYELEKEVVSVVVRRNKYVDANGKELINYNKEGVPVVNNVPVPPKKIDVNVVDVEVKAVEKTKPVRRAQGTQVQPMTFQDGSVACMRDALVSTTAGLIPFGVFYKHMVDAENAPPAFQAPAIPPHPHVVSEAKKRGYLDQRACF